MDYSKYLRQALCQLLVDVDEQNMASIVPRFIVESIAAGELIFCEGDVSDDLYVLVHGRLRVVRSTIHGYEPIAEIEPGELVGEFALLTGNARSATVVAVRQSTVLHLPSAAFKQILFAFPQINFNLSCLLANRASRGASQVQQAYKVNSILIFALHNDVEWNIVINNFITALGQYCKVHTVDHQTFESNALPYQLEYVLQQQPDTFIVMNGIDANLVTLQKMMNHADEVLVLADATYNPNVTKIEEALDLYTAKFFMPSVRLVLIHADEQQNFYNTVQWLQPRKIKQHHHVRKNDATGYKRLARFLTGNAIGVVFGGGGSRGLLHHGIIKALQEHNIHMDYACGTSIGAIVAVGYAQTWFPEEFEKIKNITQQIHPTKFDINLWPRHSLYRGKKIANILKVVVRGKNIEDLDIPCFVVTTNLNKSRGEMHTLGSAFVALQGSVSLPGIFPAITINNDLHIDGACFYNFPVELLMQQGIKKIIGIDVSSTNNESNKEGKKQLPGLVNILVNSITVNSDARQHKAKNLCTLYFRPPIANEIGLMDWKKANQHIDHAYQYANSLLSATDKETLDLLRD